MSIVKHDFGGRKRHTIRRFRKLLNLDALHEANIQANPLPYLERASERIFQLESALREAVAASRPARTPGSAPVTLTVDEAEHAALLRCRTILEKACAEIDAHPE